MKWISGITIFSSSPTVSWRGKPLTRSAADSSRKCRHPRQRVGREPDVGVEENEQRMRASPGQDPAGVLLAAPARRQRRPRISRTRGRRAGELGDDRRRGVLGVVVEDDHLEIDPATGQCRRDRRADRVFLVPGRNQDRDRGQSPLPSATRGGRKTRRFASRSMAGTAPEQENHGDQHENGHHRVHAAGRADEHVLGLEPLPPSQARNLRQRS